MRPQFLSALPTCVLLLLCHAHPAALLAADEIQADQTEGPLQRIINRFSSTRESVMLSAVCEPGTLGIKQGETGCTRCPSYTGQAGVAAGFGMESIVTGTFSRPNVAEALLNMSGCESPGGASGGTVLLRQGKEGWFRVWYQPGVRLTDCMNFRTTHNVQSLLCNRSVVTGGAEQGELVWATADERGIEVTALISWYDNMQGNPRELVTVFPSRYIRSDFNQDGRADVRVTFRVLEHRIPPQYGGALEALDRGYRLPESQKLGIIYLFDGTSLTPHPDSEPVVETLRTLLHRHAAKPAE